MNDGRVHCCLYFLSPYGHGLRPLDIGKVQLPFEKNMNQNTWNKEDKEFIVSTMTTCLNTNLWFLILFKRSNLISEFKRPDIQESIYCVERKQKN